MKFALLILLTVTSAPVFALTTYTVTSAVVDDNGSQFTISNSPATDYIPSGDSDLLSFTIGATTYDTSTFVSGVGIDNTQISADTGFIQRSGLAGNNEVLTSSTLQTGSADAASYLSHGVRGLSLSTGINYVAARDPQTSITFDASITDASALLDSTPDFIFGDVADSHSDDLLEMLNGSGQVVLSATLTNGAWSDLGTHTIDRVEYNGSGEPFVTDNNTNRGVGLLAFSIDETDLINIGNDFATEMATVTQFRLTIPGLGSEPRTDYAFLGVNINAFDVPTAVIPEPATLPSLAALAVICFFWSRARKR